MTASTSRPRTPGSRLLTIARWVFDPHILSAVVEPTIADFQQEMSDAGANRTGRLRARWRGYRAFWTLVLVAPFTSIDVPREDPGTPVLRPNLIRIGAGLTALTLLVAAGPWPLVAIAIMATIGGSLAIAIHRWNRDHPANLPTPSERRTGTPQINFSSTEVAGNVGGLIFMIGTLFIATVGFPGVMGFLLAALVAGGLLARWLVAWHASHPRRGLPEGRFAKVLRAPRP